ncbi:hypothetical protein ACQP3C_30945, partial [Escherichia coli]
MSGSAEYHKSPFALVTTTLPYVIQSLPSLDFRTPVLQVCSLGFPILEGFLRYPIIPTSALLFLT